MQIKLWSVLAQYTALFIRIPLDELEGLNHSKAMEVVDTGGCGIELRKRIVEFVNEGHTPGAAAAHACPDGAAVAGESGAGHAGGGRETNGAALPVNGDPRSAAPEATR